MPLELPVKMRTRDVEFLSNTIDRPRCPILNGCDNYGSRAVTKCSTEAPLIPAKRTGLTSLAWPVSRIERLVLVVKEDNVGSSGDTARAGWTAEYLSGLDSVEEGRIGGGITTRDGEPSGRSRGIGGTRHVDADGWERSRHLKAIGLVENLVQENERRERSTKVKTKLLGP